MYVRVLKRLTNYHRMGFAAAGENVFSGMSGWCRERVSVKLDQQNYLTRDDKR